MLRMTVYHSDPFKTLWRCSEGADRPRQPFDPLNRSDLWPRSEPCLLILFRQMIELDASLSGESAVVVQWWVSSACRLGGISARTRTSVQSSFSSGVLLAFLKGAEHDRAGFSSRISFQIVWIIRNPWWLARCSRTGPWHHDTNAATLAAMQRFIRSD